jgi:hypothetical protein
MCLIPSQRFGSNPLFKGDSHEDFARPIHPVGFLHRRGRRSPLPSPAPPETAPMLLRGCLPNARADPSSADACSARGQVVQLTAHPGRQTLLVHRRHGWRSRAAAWIPPLLGELFDATPPCVLQATAGEFSSHSSWVALAVDQASGQGIFQGITSMASPFDGPVIPMGGLCSVQLVVNSMKHSIEAILPQHANDLRVAIERELASAIKNFDFNAEIRKAADLIIREKMRYAISLAIDLALREKEVQQRIASKVSQILAGKFD